MKKIMQRVADAFKIPRKSEPESETDYVELDTSQGAAKAGPRQGHRRCQSARPAVSHWIGRQARRLTIRQRRIRVFAPHSMFNAP